MVGGDEAVCDDCADDDADRLEDGEEWEETTGTLGNSFEGDGGVDGYISAYAESHEGCDN